MSRTPRVRMRRRSERAEGGFWSSDGGDVNGMLEHAPCGRVEELVEKYAGSSVPLDEVFPDPPPPIPPHAALTGATRLPESNRAYNRPNPAEVEALAAEGAYKREAELKLLHRLLLRDATIPQIANALNQSVTYVMALRHELERRHAAEAANLDAMAHSGKTISFYREVRAVALRRADDNQISHMERVRYLSTAITAENSMHKFLQVAGFYDAAPMRPQTPTTPEDDEMSELSKAFRVMLDPDAFLHEMGELIEGEVQPILDEQYDPEQHIRTL